MDVRTMGGGRQLRKRPAEDEEGEDETAKADVRRAQSAQPCQGVWAALWVAAAGPAASSAHCLRPAPQIKAGGR